MTSSSYHELLALAVRERDLVAQGRFDELDVFEAEWEQLTATLPDPTDEDRTLLEETQLTVSLTLAALRLSLEDTRQLLTVVHRGRRAIVSYVGAARTAAVNAHR